MDKIKWKEIVDAAETTNFKLIEYYLLKSSDDSRTLTYYCYLYVDNRYYTVAIYSASISFKENGKVEAKIADVLYSYEPEEEYERNNGKILLSNVLLEAMGYDKTYILRQFDYVIDLLKSNRENAIMLYLLMKTYTMRKSVRILPKTYKFKSVTDFHLFCDRYMEKRDFRSLYDSCIQKIEA